MSPHRGMRCILPAMIAAAAGQIRVIGPDELAKSFISTHGKIQGSTATFGAPFYGDRVLGRLVWGESKGHHHCHEDDYDIPAMRTVNTTAAGARQQAPLINIVMVRRGECSFVTKVKVASKKGAHAVVIVDAEDSSLSSHALQNIIVADDGFGRSVSIPSVLISRFDGEPLIAAAKTQEVIVELAWDVPSSHVVALDLWMNSAATDSQHFLKDFANTRKTLNEVVKFTPHYDVFSGDAEMNGFSGLCSDPSAKYCAADPDGAGPVSGKDVLEEDVRQLCIHEITRVPRSRKRGLSEKAPVVFYAEKWWDYVEKLPKRCPVDSADSASRFGTQCSEALMKDLGIDVERVRHCVATTSDAKLESELVNKAWSPRALRVNGWRFSGILDAGLVTRAVCSGFIDKPEECKELLLPHEPVEEKTQMAGVGTGLFIVFGSALLICTFGILILLRKSIERRLRHRIQDEVLLEVSDAMFRYKNLPHYSDDLLDI